MNLTELQGNKKTMIQRALREHYETKIDLTSMDIKKTMSMLGKVRGLLSESRQAQSQMQNNRGYLKLVMMEQMLSSHYQDLRKAGRLVLENEEVQKSQVILAAQDMVDSVQKMIEQISKMNAEELPAVVTGVQNEIGTSEGESFQQSAGEALTQLQQALSTAKTSLTSAMAQITGEGGGMPADMGSDLDADVAADTGAEDEVSMDMDMEVDDGGEEDMGDMGDEDLGGAGREMR
jgi:hypothetical protein